MQGKRCAAKTTPIVTDIEEKMLEEINSEHAAVCKCLAEEWDLPPYPTFSNPAIHRGPGGPGSPHILPFTKSYKTHKSSESKPTSAHSCHTLPDMLRP